jgi:formamidopyrimidine-DNA glycosylase
MPELPEVETVVRDLLPLVVGRTIRKVRHGKKRLRKPWQPRWNRPLTGATMTGIRRRGKWIVMELSTSSRLVVHLGMTGQFTATPAAEPVPDHTHIVFELDEDSELRFRDPRRFGSIVLYPDESAVEEFFQGIGLGPEPFDLDAAYFREAVQRSNRTLKAILLDQRVVAGVGNIYADESCGRSGLHPSRRGCSLTDIEVDRLRAAIPAVLTMAIARRGSTIRDYVGGSGLRGGFQNEFRVYGRTGEPCDVCRAAIECIRLSGRASHFCPDCQSIGSRSWSGGKRPAISTGTVPVS